MATRIAHDPSTTFTFFLPPTRLVRECIKRCWLRGSDVKGSLEASTRTTVPIMTPLDDRRVTRRRRGRLSDISNAARERKTGARESSSYYPTYGTMRVWKMVLILLPLRIPQTSAARAGRLFSTRSSNRPSFPRFVSKRNKPPRFGWYARGCTRTNETRKREKWKGIGGRESRPIGENDKETR